MFFTNSLFSATSSSSFHQQHRNRHRHHRHYHHHLLITSLMPVAVNALLISIIAFQFGTVCSSDISGSDASRNATTTTTATTSSSISHITSSSSATNNDTYHFDHHHHQDDNDTGIYPSHQLHPHQPPPPQPKKNGSGKRRAPAECTQEPRFSILTSESLLRSANISYDENKSEIWTFGRIYLILECRASSPIDFNFEGHLINKLQSVEMTRITYDDPRMPSCYSIAITVETNRESTGNYTCWSLQEPVLSTSLYIFAHGGPPPYLLHADIGIEVIEIDTDIHDQVVTIPCVVTNPNISVALYKILFEGFELMPLGEYLSYDPKRGFLLQVRKYRDPYGKYKCIAMNSSYYDVVVNVKQPTDNFFHPPIVQGRLEIVQNRLSWAGQVQSFICNSSSQNPNIVATTDCSNPIECRLAGKCLRKSPYCSASCRCSIRGDKCPKTLESNYAQIGFPIDVGCETIPANTNGGVVECSAVNFEPSAQLTYFSSLNGLIVQNWKSVSTDELVQIDTIYDVPNMVFFVGVWIEVRCIASRFMFARGFRWKFQLSNGTIINANPKAVRSQLSEENKYIAEDMMVKITRPDIASLSCYAPIWNETGWVHNTLELLVKDSVAPTFEHPENSTLTFYINSDRNNSIVCEAEGYPMPDIMWFKNGEEYFENLIIDKRSKANITQSYVLLSDLGLFDDQAVFVCNATNPRGTIVKAFTINVREESLRLTLILSGTAFILLLGVFGIILWIFYTSSRRNQGKPYPNIDDKEIEDFFKGNPDAMEKCGDGVLKAIYHPYDQTFEINPEDLLIGKVPITQAKLDNEISLGQGQFGIVLRGDLQTKQGSHPVAVKMAKNSDPMQLRCLLSELKIMTFIGKHENIVNLIGAITKDIKKHVVHVVVEYCQLGNLEEYLKKHRGTFFDEFRDSGLANSCLTRNAPVSYVRLEYLVKTSDLIIWAYQIANGMEYLTSRKIIHGDIALRNMLLDSNQNVKITDFGLSKHIYTQSVDIYESKKKTQDNPLPWRWLAPETLKNSIFSMSGDVWSFGVLLYELFSLGQLPYYGITNYSEDFLKLLESGSRLSQPSYANSEIYSTMRSCWVDPDERPNFTILKRFFFQYIRMQHPPNQSEIVQQMQLRQFHHHNRSHSTDMDTDSSDLDKEDTTTLTTFIPTANSFSTFGSANSIISGGGQLSRPKGMIA